MGRWSQSAYEHDLLSKVKTLFQESVQQLLRDSQHDFNFETFVSLLDENDRAIRRSFDGFVKEVYRRHRKTRHRASPYPELQNRLRAYSTNDSNPLSNLRRNTLSNGSGISNNNNSNNNGQNNDSFSLLRQLTDALNEELASRPSPVMELPFNVAADELTDWLELDIDGSNGGVGSSSSNISNINTNNQQQHSSGNSNGGLNEDRYNGNWINMSRVPRNNTVRPWRSNMTTRRSSTVSDSGQYPPPHQSQQHHFSSHPSSADTSAAPTRTTSAASSPFLRVLSRLGNGSNMLEIPDEESTGGTSSGGNHGTSMSTPNLGSGHSPMTMGEPNPVAIAAAAAALRHPLIRARRRSSVVAGSAPISNTIANTPTSIHSGHHGTTTSMSNAPTMDGVASTSTLGVFNRINNPQHTSGSSTALADDTFLHSYSSMLSLPTTETTSGLSTSTNTSSTNTTASSSNNDRIDTARRPTLPFYNPSYEHIQHLRASLQHHHQLARRHLTGQALTPNITLSSSSSPTTIGITTRSRSMSTTSVTPTNMEIDRSLSAHTTLRNPSLLVTPNEEIGAGMGITVPVRRISLTPMPIPPLSAQHQRPTSSIVATTTTTSAAVTAFNNSSHTQLTSSRVMPRTPSPEEDERLT